MRTSYESGKLVHKFCSLLLKKNDFNQIHRNGTFCEESPHGMRHLSPRGMLMMEFFPTGRMMVVV